MVTSAQIKRHVFGEPHPETVKTLKQLKRKIGLSTQAGCQARVEFTLTVLKHDLADKLRHHDLFDEHNLSDRDLDTCFEMHDGDEVAKGIMQVAVNDCHLQAAIIQEFSLQTYDKWLVLYATSLGNEQRQGCLL